MKRLTTSILKIAITLRSSRKRTLHSSLTYLYENKHIRFNRGIEGNNSFSWFIIWFLIRYYIFIYSPAVLYR